MMARVNRDRDFINLDLYSILAAAFAIVLVSVTVLYLAA